METLSKIFTVIIMFCLVVVYAFIATVIISFVLHMFGVECKFTRIWKKVMYPTQVICKCGKVQ